MRNTSRFLGGIFILIFASGLLASCADPRKNCNHPQHGIYMKEHMMKKRGL